MDHLDQLFEFEWCVDCLFELEELKAPQGYELLEKPVAITVKTDITPGSTSFVLKNVKQTD
ncbi:SpaA isopeptide-forming pilin-related protein, partial [Erysipelothrix rhusiopathiae]|nr:SpaA isopeptide-forming pilin-related protein [Erysipelothrix rhusiopathiae]